MSGTLSDCMIIRKVAEPNPDYRKPGQEIMNWFDRDEEIEREGYFSIKDSIASIKANSEAAAVLNEMVAPLQRKLVEAYGNVAENVDLPPEVRAMMDKMPLEVVLKQFGAMVTPELNHKLNHALNQVKK